ncbi:nitrous oxide-stimulated promoter family protein [Vibrio ziniensis]|uniref:Nitrous oxide-stimulated promoter family protein n=1 Tax=Vibrio ziniensis TaxID=2711221 RepID=A0A6G7CPY1_9VIBR|nr:nitrous oxide-stimulated promoter family protein [Vibrio ziniensis]QIH44150.1 nitrous oxide-stimulated promoter family protein [Vibrio ziniensis]
MTKPTMLLLGSLQTEFKTVSAMVRIYCRKHHASKTALCEGCKSLLHYAEIRLDRCPYGQNKPTCNRCPIHCYKPEPKESMRLVMRYSGPRMLLVHPILAIRHLLHERKEPPPQIEKDASNRHQRLKASKYEK